MMAGISGKNTKPEIVVRKMLFANGYRFRINKKIGNARPDLVLPKWNLCIFVHGCFWHRHSNCKFAVTPKTNSDFWSKKLDDNVLRDSRNLDELQLAGWVVGIVWECALKDLERLKCELLKNVPSDRHWSIRGDKSFN